MKKILLFLTIILTFNVYAKEYDYKMFTYTININGQAYTASVKYWDLYKSNVTKEDAKDRFSIDWDSLILTDEEGKRYIYGDIENTISGLGGFCLSNTNIEYACGSRTDFSYDEINNSEFMKNYLPKFMKFDSKKNIMGDYTEFVAFVSNDSEYTNDQKEEFYNQYSEYVKKQQTDQSGMQIYRQSFAENNGSSDITYKDKEQVNSRNLPLDEYYRLANELYILLNEASDIRVCTEDDLNAIRSQRNIPFSKLGQEFDASISTSCYSVMFKSNGIYDLVKQGYAFGSEKGAQIDDKDNEYKMAYLFFKSYYLQGYGFLTGESMQKEIKEVTKCSIFGNETYDLLQNAFNILKYIGLILGTLLGIVDIFKAVVQKDDSGKKQFSTLFKRIIAILLLFLTPVLVEFIFELISSIGITDPICGIR